MALAETMTRMERDASKFPLAREEGEEGRPALPPLSSSL